LQQHLQPRARHVCFLVDDMTNNSPSSLFVRIGPVLDTTWSAVRGLLDHEIRSDDVSALRSRLGRLLAPSLSQPRSTS
jgi:hypothetical protein